MPRKKQPFSSPSRYLTAVSSGNGRPKLILNEEGKQLCEILFGYMCTDEDVADTLHTSTNVLMNRNNKEAFLEAKKRGLSKGKVSIRRNQMKLSEKSAAMAIYLGKVYLNQREEPELDTQQQSDDGFLEALSGTAAEDWSDDES